MAGMRCARCGREFRGGERRVRYRVGWVCWFCVRTLRLAPLNVRCWFCGNAIGLNQWDHVLADVVSEGGEVVGRYVHKGCLAQ